MWKLEFVSMCECYRTELIIVKDCYKFHLFLNIGFKAFKVLATLWISCVSNVHLMEIINKQCCLSYEGNHRVSFNLKWLKQRMMVTLWVTKDNVFGFIFHPIIYLQATQVGCCECPLNHGSDSNDRTDHTGTSFFFAFKFSTNWKSKSY